MKVFKVSTLNSKTNDDWKKVEFKTISKAIDFNKTQWEIITICIASGLFLTIMILTKLCPCFYSVWTQDFCDRWNDFWFSISSSFVAAILFYIFFSAIPNRRKRKEIESIISYELGSVLVHLNTMVVLLTGKYFNPTIGVNEDVDQFMRNKFADELSKLDWDKKQSYLMDAANNKNTIECIKFEINNAQKRLEKIRIQFGPYFTNEEISIFNKDILHNEIIQHIVTISDTESLPLKTKENISKMFFDFYYNLFFFFRRFKRSDDLSW